jgi:hypothetical protein
MPNHKNSNKTSFEQRLVMAIARGLWFLILLPFKKGKNNSPIIEQRWRDIQGLMARDDNAAWTTAILKADSLLDDILKEKYAGNNLGERLKNARNKLEPDVYNLAWHAHILRNKIAHDNLNLNKRQAQEAIYGFRSVLNSLGVL